MYVALKQIIIELLLSGLCLFSFPAQIVVCLSVYFSTLKKKK